jgi:predicted AAA+ superfamily ATPase
LRDLTRVQDIDQLISLSRLIIAQAGQLANFSTMAKQISVTVDTIRRWLDVLESFYFSHRIRPWFKNVSKSLRKQPKIYPIDWSVVPDPGARCECMVAGHLLKAVHHWSDCGMGKFALHYVRDTGQREVDFLIVRDGSPWLLVEVKTSAKEPLSPALKHFAKELTVPYAFQAVLEMDYVQADCFASAQRGQPMRVPLRTLLAQLP